MRILFIVKKNQNYDFQCYTRKSSGLFNSTRFIVEGLAARGIHASIVEVIDNNCIDREVTKFKPNIVVIEALWVVPEKFPILKRLHPKVKWVCHLHSHMPFLALEGNSIDWIIQYAKQEIGLIANSVESYQALRAILNADQIIYLPNVYISEPRKFRGIKSDTHVNIGCFGAIRPLKNQLLQALAAIEFANEIGKKLRFFINGTRIETGGHPVLKNLRALFNGTKGTELIQVKWCEPEEFLDLLQNEIDIGMQVSLTETFNVVSADYVTAGIPIVVSNEVKWASDWNKAEVDSVPDIVRIMHRVYGYNLLVRWNQKLLKSFSEDAQEDWYNWVISQGAR